MKSFQELVPVQRCCSYAYHYTYHDK